MMDNGEGAPIPHPKETPDDEPASSNTKQKLVDTLERSSLEGIQIIPQESAMPVRITPLEGEQDGVPVIFEVDQLSKGIEDKPSLRWKVQLQRPNEMSILEQYDIYLIPDGWDVERHERIITAENEAEMTKAFFTGDTDVIDEAWEAKETSAQQAREWGMAAASEGQAKQLIKLLENSRKREIE